VTVTCRVHGPMRYRVPLCWWECVGFDGEGCDAPVVRDEDLARADVVVSVPDAEAKRLAARWRTLAGKE
jgi:hypothetical protein